MKTSRFAIIVASLGIALALGGCDKKPEEKPAEAAPQHVSENDQYLERMKQEVKIDDADSLIEDVNESVGNDDNAEKAKQLAAQGVSGKVDAAPAAAPTPAPEAPAAAPEAAPAPAAAQ